VDSNRWREMRGPSCAREGRRLDRGPGRARSSFREYRAAERNGCVPQPDCGARKKPKNFAIQNARKTSSFIGRPTRGAHGQSCELSAPSERANAVAGSPGGQKYLREPQLGSRKDRFARKLHGRPFEQAANVQRGCPAPRTTRSGRTMKLLAWAASGGNKPGGGVGGEFLG